VEPLHIASGKVNSVESSMAILQNNKNKITIWSSHPTSGYVSKEIDSQVLNRYAHSVHNIIIHNSQEIEATQGSYDRGTDK
jgi:hypothetical protein